MFLASPEEADAELKGASTDELIAKLKEEGVSDLAITMATVNILPYLPGQEAPGVPSTEVPK